MDEVRLLRFRWEGKEYGVPVEDVIAITEWTWKNGADHTGTLDHENNSQGNPIPVLCMQGGFGNSKNKQAIVLNGHGVELVLIVDEVITASRLSDEVVVDVTQASFKIWHF